VAVPDAFFKVVVSLKKEKEKGIAFYYENTEENQPMETAVRSIDQIEKITKLDFFSELSDDVENKIEAETQLWR
jgi:endonuclease G